MGMYIHTYIHTYAKDNQTDETTPSHANANANAVTPPGYAFLYPICPFSFSYRLMNHRDERTSRQIDGREGGWNSSCHPINLFRLPERLGFI